jgi:hypothetical protein
MLMPNLSFAGHLSGIVAGTFQLYGILNAVIPSESFLLQMDDWNSIRWLSSRPSFVGTTSIQNLRLGNAVLWMQRSGGLGFISTFLAKSFESCKIAVFGRGRLANENIHLGRLSWGSQEQPISGSTDHECDDDLSGPLLSRDSPLATTSQIV